ncbi:hypothetical protein MHM88_12275 [Epibacterium sp. MM17-32]|uniref:GAD-like domain-containing protein n=1 Tax=Epibacterium sp. MM17-32 TaxID=2917734 RepID=UPI001EF69D0A|nr:GAD-like domain-containing protein [Epibacterium sp. MM17-32]MCG7628584.1 hypothetical protein [Epibacterium sp. MM17-32]
MSDLFPVLGPVPDDAMPVAPDTLARWQPRLPPLLIEVWATYGLVSVAMGRVHLLEPARLAGLMDFIFGNDPELAGDTHAIAYGNLGELMVWSQRHGFGFLSPILSTLEMPNLTGDTAIPAERQIRERLLQIPPQMIEVHDGAQQPLYDRLAAALGPLPDGMVYAPRILPPRPGGRPVEDYGIVPLETCLEDLYTAYQVSIVDWARANPMLRFVKR